MKNFESVFIGHSLYIRTNKFDFARIAQPEKKQAEKPAKIKISEKKQAPQKAKTVKMPMPAKAMQPQTIAAKIQDNEPIPAPIPAPIPSQAKPQKEAKRPQAKAENYDHLTPAEKAAITENLQADINRLLKQKTEIAAEYSYLTAREKLEPINKRLKELYFLRSKIAPVPQMPKLKKVIFSGFKSGEFIGTDAQILNHLKNIKTCQKQAEKEGLPCDGLRVQILPA
jgi:hypothetical protein